VATTATLKSRLRKRLARAPLRYVAEPIFQGIVAAELRVVRYLERPEASPTPAQLSQVTAIVKTFERPLLLRRLVSSLRRRFPGLAITVADDSRVPSALPGVRTLRLDYDVGVSAGRQAALAEVQTPYTWVLDDDFIAYSGTRLGRVLQTLQNYPQLDLVGGPVIDLPFWSRRGSPTEPVYPTAAAPLLPLGSRLGPTLVCDKVPNFFVARTDRLRLVGWDARLKRVEHGDFFTRARGLLVTAFDDGFSCLHAQAPFDVEYMRRRDDHAADEELLRARHFSSG
jgi:hypothetical protein